MNPKDQPGHTSTASNQQSYEPTPRVGIFQAFRFADYRFLWFGMLFTSIAMWVQHTTMGWVVYDITGSGALLGSVTAIRSIPTLLAGPFAGMAADRFPRQRVITSTQVVLILCTTGLGLLLLFNRVEVWHLFAFTFLAGLAQAFNQPARQTMVFDVVPRYVVPNAVALNNLAGSTSRTLGPMVGGALIVLMGPANNFFLQALAYGAVTVTILFMHLPKKRADTTPKQPMLKNMAEGYRFALTDPQARLLLLMSAISPIFLIPVFFGVMPIYAKVSFNTDASGLGIMLAAVGVGGFFGGLLTAALSNVDRRGMVQLIALFVFSLSLVGFSVVAGLTGNLLLALPFLFVSGGAEALYNTTNQTVLQLIAPDHLRGRLASVLQIQPVLWPLGGLMAGAAADHVNVAIVGAVLSGCAFLIGLVLFFFSPRTRTMRLSQLGHHDTPVHGDGHL